MVGLLIPWFALPALADLACATGSVSSILHSTCDIGALQFTFEDFTVGGVALTPADLTFTPFQQVLFGETITGYRISSSAGPQSVTAPANGDISGIAALNYKVVSLAGEIDGTKVSGGALSASGSFAYALYLNSARDEITGTFLSDRYIAEGGVTSHDSLPGVIPQGDLADGSSVLFQFSATNGSSVEWDGTPGEFSFVTFTPTPEPSAVLLLSAVVILLGCISYRGRQSSRPFR